MERPPSPRHCASSSAPLVMLAMLVACTPSSDPDPRCRIDASGRHKAEIARQVNGSGLWAEYFDVVAPTGGAPRVTFSFTVERIRRRSVGGDYDSGKVEVVFRATHIGTSKTLYEHSGELELDAFMIGRFDAESTREEIQEIAFQATEEQIYPFLGRWIDLAAIEAMATETGSTARRFAPTLEKVVADKWNGDLCMAAEDALKKIGS